MVGFARRPVHDCGMFFKCFVVPPSAESTNSALDTVTDAFGEFMHSFMGTLTGIVQQNPEQHLTRKLDIATVERCYFAQHRSSLLSLHNYYKNEVIQRNRAEHRDFAASYGEYERLMEETERAQKNRIAGGGGGGGSGIKLEELAQVLAYTAAEGSISNDGAVDAGPPDGDGYPVKAEAEVDSVDGADTLLSGGARVVGMSFLNKRTRKTNISSGSTG